MMRRRRKIMVIKCSGGRVDINQPEDNRACFDHLLRTIYRTGCTWYKSCRKWKWMKKEIMIETMQQCSLADFTLEASSVVNTAGGSNRFAFNVHSTFATLIHVRLRGLVDDEWDTLWNYYWVMEMILMMAMLLSPCNPFRRRSCPPRSSKCQLSLPRTQSSAAGSPSLTSSRNQQSSLSSSYISLHKSQYCSATQEGQLAC